jgi:hypothetical protein
VEAIDKIFLDYCNKGYIEKVTDETDKRHKDCHYINFFPIVHKDLDLMKVRIVFDATLVNKQGKSVNSEIEKKPN